MAKSKDPSSYPLEYEDLLQQAFEQPLVLEWDTTREAHAFRFDFYGWTHALEAQAQSNPRYQLLAIKARQLQLSFEPPTTIKIVNRGDSTISQQLRAKGFQARIAPFGSSSNLPEAGAPPTLNQPNPLKAFEDTMARLGYSAGPTTTTKKDSTDDK